MYEIHFSSLKNIFYIFFSEIQKIKPQIFNTFKLEYELPSNKFVIPLKTSRYFELHSVSISSLFFIKLAIFES